jgi:type I restriction enzyme R subunit
MPKIEGKAKGMVVARSRIQAVKYKQAFDAYISERGYPIKSLVAFSGTVKDELDLEYTESGMNGFGEREVPAKFASEEFRVLLVAEKYQTGFDQPLLQAMYVDKRLDGVKAVQTLSRLNRIYPGKDDTFVLDFVNEADAIREAFLPYFEEAYMPEETDPNLLYDLMNKIADAQVLWPENIEAAWQALEGTADVKLGNAALNAALDPAVERFKDKEPSEQEEFRGQLQGYVRLYAYLLHIVPFADVELLKLYEVGRFLLRKLPRKNAGEAFDLDDQVALRYYRLTKTGEHKIAMGDDELPGLYGPTAVGTLEVHDSAKAPLSELIDRINQLFGADLGPEAMLTIEQVQDKMVANEALAEQAKANSLENYRHGFEPAFLDALVELRQGNVKFFNRAIEDEAFRKFIADSLRPEVYRQQRGSQPGAGGSA